MNTTRPAEQATDPVGVESSCPGSVGPAGRSAARRFVRLRWLAIAVVAASSAAAHAIGIIDNAVPLYSIAGGLTVANAIFEVSLRANRAGPYAVCIQMMIDLMALTGLLHFAGGAANPLVALYIIHAILAAILLPPMHSYMVAASACMLFAVMALGQLLGFLEHHPLRILAEDPVVSAQLAADPRYVLSMVGVCVLLVGVAVFFVSPVMEDLRAREAALNRARGRLQAVIDSIEDSIVLFGEDGDPVAWNRSAHASWPYPGQSPAAVWGKGREGAAAVYSEEREEQGRFLRDRLFPVEEAHAGMVWVAEDITERRKVEAQARYQERMAALGLLAAGVAHEIRNPLASISAIVEDLKSAVGDVNLEEELTTVASHVFRISRVLGQLGDFASPPGDTRTVVDVGDAVRDALAIIRFDPRCRELSLEETLAEGLPGVMANSDQLVQVFLNLGLNAIEAMSAGGELRLRSYCENRDVCVEFHDTGHGVDADLLERIFEPFFTTKEGTGLGLSVCDNIVQAHGGRITVVAAAGPGTVVTVRLPAHGADNSTA